MIEETIGVEKDVDIHYMDFNASDLKFRWLVSEG